MKTTDHVALAKYLLLQTEQEELLKHRNAFIWGCVEPDWNPFSYLRGFIRKSPFKGHNAENADAHIRRCMDKLSAGGACSAWRCFVLGALLHYVADAFTYPHNAAFEGDLRAHIRYESALHRRFAAALVKAAQGEARDYYSVRSYYERQRSAYCADAQRDDCAYIIRVCRTVFTGLLHEPQNAAGYYPLWEA